jgi:hypothetical protein
VGALLQRAHSQLLAKRAAVGAVQRQLSRSTSCSDSEDALAPCYAPALPLTTTRDRDPAPVLDSDDCSARLALAELELTRQLDALQELQWQLDLVEQQVDAGGNSSSGHGGASPAAAWLPGQAGPATKPPTVFSRREASGVREPEIRGRKDGNTTSEERLAASGMGGADRHHTSTAEQVKALQEENRELQARLQEMEARAPCWGVCVCVLGWSGWGGAGARRLLRLLPAPEPTHRPSFSNLISSIPINLSRAGSQFLPARRARSADEQRSCRHCRASTRQRRSWLR